MNMAAVLPRIDYRIVPAMMRRIVRTLEAG